MVELILLLFFFFLLKKPNFGLYSGQPINANEYSIGNSLQNSSLHPQKTHEGAIGGKWHPKKRPCPGCSQAYHRKISPNTEEPRGKREVGEPSVMGQSQPQPHGCGGTPSVGQGEDSLTHWGITSLGKWEMPWDAGKEYFVISQEVSLDVEGGKQWQGKE